MRLSAAPRFGYGRNEFLALRGALVRPRAGMRDAIGISGPLTPAVRDLFVRLEPSFDSERKLWDYQLVQDGTVVLSCRSATTTPSGSTSPPGRIDAPH